MAVRLAVVTIVGLAVVPIVGLAVFMTVAEEFSGIVLSTDMTVDGRALMRVVLRTACGGGGWCVEGDSEHSARFEILLVLLRLFCLYDSGTLASGENAYYKVNVIATSRLHIHSKMNNFIESSFPRLYQRPYY